MILHLIAGIFLILAAFDSMLSARESTSTSDIVIKIASMVMSTVLTAVNLDIYLRSL